MAITLNGGTGVITGVAVGGLPDGVVDAGTLATNSVDSAELIDGAIDASHLASGVGTPIIGASAYRSGGQLIADSTNVQIQLNAEIYDTNSDFDHSSGYDYVVPENGKYVVCATIYLDAGNTTGYMEVMIYKNGSIIRGWQHRPVIATSQGFGGTCVLNLATNDSIELWLVHNMGSSIDVVSSSTLNVFDIQKIAE